MEDTKMTIAERFWKVLASPGQTLNVIAEDPRILWPGLIIIVITLILTVVVMPETIAFTEQNLVASGMSPDQIAMAMKFVAPGIIFGIIFTMPLTWLIQAGILALYNQITVGEATFKQLFSIAIFTSVPSIIKTVISTGLIKTMGIKASLEVSTSLALFLGSTDSPSFLYRLLGMIELFSIWGLILIILGGAIAMKKKPQGLAIYLGILWIIYAVVMAALTKTPVA